MHPNPTFRAEVRATDVAFARARGFGVLAVNGAEGPVLSHVPFLLDADGGQAGLHLVRSNPIVGMLRAGALEARIAVSGPDGYVSPDWYEVDDQVPTWNYVAVHLVGRLELRPPDELETLLRAQSADFEARLEPKRAWTMDKMSEGMKQRMMRQIVPCRMDVGEIQSTWKLNQNKPDEVRLRAAEQMAREGKGQEVGRLAQMMRDA